MPNLRIALAQVNATVGDISANSDLVLEWSGKAHEAGAHLVLFPEMVLTGYPVEDLALRRSLTALGSTDADAATRWRPWRSYAVLHLWAMSAPALFTRHPEPPETPS